MRHTISVVVQNRFGVLTRIAGLFSGRGFNIDTLNVGPTQNDKISRMTIVVVGNEKGQVGVGVGKAGDVIGAVRKGVADGKKHLVKVPLTRHSSIPTLSNGCDGAASVLIRPAAPGTGVIAGGSIRTVLELAGIKNVLAKRLGSKTPLNNARAAMQALAGLRTHKETAKERGISLEQIYS